MPAADGDDAFGAAAVALQSLRARGAAAVDPVGLAHAQALARRGARQDAAVRRCLAPRLAQATATLAARLDAAPPIDAVAPPSSPPLRSLLQALGSDEAGELKSVQRLRPALARWRVERQITRALARAPDNPGPLNSEHLLLRTLQQLQATAPAMLGAFVTQVETLLWLDEARGETAPRAGARRGSSR
jgi:hypothetical protein